MTLMQKWRSALRRRDDAGFSLVETMVALMLLAVVASGAAMFMIRSTTATKGLEDRQVATTVARQVMEEVRAVSPTFSSTHQSSLVRGRGQASAIADWTAAAPYGVSAAQTYTGGTFTAYDGYVYSQPGPSDASPVVPHTRTVTVKGHDYQVRTLIGLCQRPRASGTCTKLPTGQTGDELFRVVVLVTWTPNQASDCPAVGCSYAISTLIDPAQQPTFNTLRKPIAFDDPDVATGVTIDVVAGETAMVPVVDNDSGYFPLSGAVSISVQATKGTAVGDTATNMVRYTANPTATGTDTFYYQATDTQGTATNAAKVTVTIRPKAVDDTVTVTARSSTLTTLLNNDRGQLSGATVRIIQPPTGATATASGSQVTFAITGTPAASYTFTYAMVESSGAQSAPATVTVLVSQGAAPTASNLAVAGNFNSSTVFSVSGSTTPAAGLTLSIVSVSAGSAATTGTPGQISYTPTVGYAGSAVVRYRVTDGWNRTAEANATVNVARPALTAGDATLTVPVGQASASVDLSALVQRYGAVTVATSSPKAAHLGNLVVRYTPTATESGTSTFTYTVTDTYGSTATGTVTVTVLRAVAPTAGNRTVSFRDDTTVLIGLGSVITPSTGMTVTKVSGSGSIEMNAGPPVQPVIRVSYPNPGTYQIRYRVTDPATGLFDEGTITSVVTN